MREEMKNLLEMPIEELMQMSVEELEKYSEEERAQAWRRVAAERLREASAGVLHLFQPMRSRGEAVSELHYDFSVLTSREFIACRSKQPGHEHHQPHTGAQAVLQNARQGRAAY